MTIDSISSFIPASVRTTRYQHASRDSTRQATSDLKPETKVLRDVSSLCCVPAANAVARRYIHAKSRKPRIAYVCVVIRTCILKYIYIHTHTHTYIYIYIYIYYQILARAIVLSHICSRRLKTLQSSHVNSVDVSVRNSFRYASTRYRKWWQRRWRRCRVQGGLNDWNQRRTERISR